MTNPGRPDDAALVRDIGIALRDPLVRTFFEAGGTAVFVVDERRRVVAANAIARDVARVGSEAELEGRFLGEILGCVHTGEGAARCGAGPSCQACGGMKAVTESIALGRRAEEECLVTRSHDGVEDATELHVIATPLEIGGHRFALVSLRDISDEKRRRTLERVFVHDLNNIVASLAAWVDLLDDPDAGIRSDAAARVRRLTRKVVEEMRSHSLLTLVEATGFVPTWRTCAPAEVVDQLAAAIAPGEEGDSPVEIVRPVPKRPFVTDVALLVRVLVNMVRNAVEAAPQGPIRIECVKHGDAYRFSVNNPGVIPEDVAAWIFTRSFSTKAAQGRGLGTYSMKLFGERVLGGKVGFTSGAAEGTTFYIDHPMARRPG